MGELGTVSWAFEGSHSVNLPQIFLPEAKESMSHIFGPEKFATDGGSNVLKLDNPVVSDCGDTHLQGGDARPASCTLGYVLGVADTEQTFSCQPGVVVSGTQPVCELLRCPARKSDSEYGVDVCIDRADERSWGVSWASGCSIVEDPAVWTRMTNDSGTDGGLTTCEPQAGADLSPWQLSRVGLRRTL